MMDSGLEEADAALAMELELISASFLPSEQVTSSSPDTWPRHIVITSSDSGMAIHLDVDQTFPKPSSVSIELKRSDMDREEALAWKAWIADRLTDWKQEDEPSLYEVLTTHLLPLLAKAEPETEDPPERHPVDQTPSGPHHVLLSSHHLIAPSKRKDLQSLSSDLSIVGFAKIGHPGIMYATGDRDDLVEWLREVKSWQWLALRVRIGVEPIPPELQTDQDRTSRGAQEGARGGKGRGQWQEVEKIGEALEWLRSKGREKLLLDLGMGAGSG